jgi:hypothetical protein
MTTRIEPFDMAHINLMELKQEYVDEVFRTEDGLLQLEYAAERGDAFTLMHEGRILCVGGVSMVWPGVGQMWLIPSQYVNDYSLVFVRTVRNFLESMMKSHELHRMQAVISSELPNGEKWIRGLGFQKEGKMQQYSASGVDYYLYGKLRI